MFVYCKLFFRRLEVDLDSSSYCDACSEVVVRCCKRSKLWVLEKTSELYSCAVWLVLLVKMVEERLEACEVNCNLVA